MPFFDDRLVGTQGYMLFAASVDVGAGDQRMPFMTPPPARSGAYPTLPGNYAFIPIRAWASQVSRGFSDVTASCHYEPNTDMVYPAGIPTTLAMEIRAEGLMHLDVIPYTVVLNMFSGAEPSRVILGFDDYNPFFEGDCLVTNFICSTPINDAVSYSCVIRPYGAFTLFPELGF